MSITEKRIKCVQNFYDLGTYKWIASVDFYADRFIENTTEKCFYKKGVTYYGLPYSFHNKVKFEDFKVDNLSDTNVVGTDCIYAVFDALGIKDEKLLAFHSLDLLCGRTFAAPLGNITIVPEMVKTFHGYRNFTVADVYEGFAELKPADVIVTYFNKKNVGFVGHVRMVTGYPVITYDDNGKVNPLLSYVPLSECKSSFTDSADMLNFGINSDNIISPDFNQELTDIQSFADLKGRNTNFIFNKSYSFQTLYNQYAHNFNVYCVPMRFSMFDERKAVYEEVCNILCELKPKIDLNRNGSFMEENVLDSLEFFSLIASLSEKFNITLGFEDLAFKHFKTADTITDLVLSKRN